MSSIGGGLHLGISFDILNILMSFLKAEEYIIPIFGVSTFVQGHIAFFDCLG